MTPKSTKQAVVYMTGDKGPFRCDHCEYFQVPRACKIVEGSIDPKGCCNLYEPESLLATLQKRKS
jgi:hypothetical protein